MTNEDFARENGFVRITNRTFKVQEHWTKDGELHHKSLTLSKLTDLEGQVHLYRNADGLVLLIPA